MTPEKLFHELLGEDLEGEVLATLVLNKLRGGLRCCAIKAPGFGDRRKAMCEDLAILTGAKFISDDLGVKLEKVDLAVFGRSLPRTPRPMTQRLSRTGLPADMVFGRVSRREPTLSMRHRCSLISIPAFSSSRRPGRTRSCFWSQMRRSERY